jgi:hypothetical protein
MSVPQNSSYWSEVYQACEPCYSKMLGGANQCIFTAPPDPRDDDYYDWLVTDEDVVIPPKPTTTANGRPIIKPGDPFPPCGNVLNHGCWYREMAPGDIDNCLSAHEVTLQAKRLKAVFDAQHRDVQRYRAKKK